MSTASASSQARMYLGANRPQEAIRVLESALASEPDNPDCLRLLAQAHLGAANGALGGSNAMPAAQRAIELNPSDSHAWRIMSICYSRLGAHQQARDAARRARELSPDHWISHTVVAHADATARVVTDDTHASVAEAIRLGPNQPEVHFAAGHVAQAIKDYRLATEHYQRALALDPEHEGARNNLALIAMRRGNAGSAVAGFTSMLAQNPNSELALRNLRATGFNALRIVYIIVVVSLIISRSGDMTARGIAAAIAVGSVVAYVLWIRHRAGVYFARFVRSAPATDKLLTVWAAILALTLVVVVVAVFLPDRIARDIGSFVQFGLIITILCVSVINSARRRS